MQATSPPRITRVEAMGGAVEVGVIDDGIARTGPLLEAPPSRVWAVLPAAYEAVGLPANLSDPGSRSIGVTGQATPRRIAGRTLNAYVNCGSGPAGSNALFYRVTLDVVTRLVPDESGGTRLATTVSGSAKPRAVSGHPVPCSSLGTLERLIATKVRELVDAGVT